MMDIAVRIIVDIIYVAIAAITVAIYVKRGFFESVFRFGKYIAAIVISYFVGPFFGNLICTKFMHRALANAVENSVLSFLDSTAGAVDIDALIDSLPLLIRRFIDVGQTKANYGSAVSNFDEVAADFSKSVTKPIAVVISDAIAYILVFFAALFVLWVIVKLLNKIFEARGLNVINGVLGGLFGILTAILLMIVLTWILNLILAIVGFDSKIAEYVRASGIYSFFGGR